MQREKMESMPENCLSEILSLTSPRDACRASVVSIGFKSAAESDIAWDKFLPPAYREIISRAVFPVTYSTKKELYLRLCDSPTILDGGNVIFMLNKHTGKTSYLLGARALSIAWADNPAYWKWTSLPQSSFMEVAELLGVRWLEIRGKIRTRLLSPETRYGAYLVFKFAENTNGLHEAAKAMVRVSSQRRNDRRETEEEEESKTIHLRLPKLRYERRPSTAMVRLIKQNTRTPTRRKDRCWMEVEVGEFYNARGNDDEEEEELEMQFMETKHLHWKSGLVVEGIEIRPKLIEYH